jgi:serine/threonine-protein kinase
VIGTTVSHYRIVEKLGEGGMGVVYRAEDTKLGRTVGLKFLRAEFTRDAHAKERFVQEARAASALDHPNICTIHEIDETDTGELFISMACYEGETVKDRLARGPLEIMDAIDIALQVAAGLGKAHGRGIVHRDIKPGNIFLKRDGLAKILDFGLAKLADQTKLTKVGSTVGTVSYMSPEQARGRKIDPRTDIWSLGVVLYEMVSGLRPFRGEHEQAVLYSICQEPPEPIAGLRDDIPQALAGIIARCLRKDADERYRTIGELSDDLSALREAIRLGVAPTTQGEWPPPVPPPPPPPPPKRKRIVVVVSFVTVVLLGVGLWYAIPPPLPEMKYLAILPPVALGDPEEQAFADGFTEYLTFRLSQLERHSGSFWVEAGTYVRSRGVATVDDARTNLGATLALTGTIERRGNDVGVHLDLIDAESGRTIKTIDHSESLGNVVALQNDIVLHLARLLGVGATAEASRDVSAGGTTVPTAFEAYLTGTGHVIRLGGTKESRVRAAIGFFGDAVALDPGYVLALAALGDAHWRLYGATADTMCIGEAVDALERSVAGDDVLANPHVTLGEISADAGRYEEAEAQFLRALEIDDLHLHARNGLAETYYALGEYDRAELQYQQAIELRPWRWVGHCHLGIFYVNREEYENAARKFLRVIELAPENTTGYTNLAQAYAAEENYELAHETMKRANDELELDFDDYLTFGTLYFYMAKYADAADMYDKARSLDDSEHFVWGYLGSAYEWVPGGGGLAKEAYREAARRAEESRRARPDDPMLLCFLGGYYASLGDTAAAIDLTEQALALDAEDAVLMFQAGHNYEVLEDREHALHWIGAALARGYPRSECETTPALRGLCTDPRYAAIVESL